MIVGRLRDRVTLQRPTVTNDGGAVTTAYTTLASRVPADVQTATASRAERLFGSQVTAVTSYVITLRSGLDVAMSDRVTWHHTSTSNVVMEITGIATQGTRKEITVLLCEVRA